MTFEENIFCMAVLVLVLILTLFHRRINFAKLGFVPKHSLAGIGYVAIFNVSIFALVQSDLYFGLLQLPSWMLDKDPFFGLLLIVFLQEILFRSLAISFLEKYGRRRAYWLSIIIFMLFHVLAPYSWYRVGIVFAVFTFIGGAFWGWYFQKYRNIYLLTISHLLVNLSFNFLLLYK